MATNTHEVAFKLDQSMLFTISIERVKQRKKLLLICESFLLNLQANCKKQPQCEICFRSFKGPGMLKMHMKTHEVNLSSNIFIIYISKSMKFDFFRFRHLTSNFI